MAYNLGIIRKIRALLLTCLVFNQVNGTFIQQAGTDGLESGEVAAVTLPDFKSITAEGMNGAVVSSSPVIRETGTTARRAEILPEAASNRHEPGQASQLSGNRYTSSGSIRYNPTLATIHSGELEPEDKAGLAASDSTCLKWIDKHSGRFARDYEGMIPSLVSRLHRKQPPPPVSQHRKSCLQWRKPSPPTS